MEFVACAVETQHDLARIATGRGGTRRVLWRHGRDWAGGQLGREKLVMGLTMGVDAETSGLEVVIMSSAAAAGPQVKVVHCLPY